MSTSTREIISSETLLAWEEGRIAFLPDTAIVVGLFDQLYPIFIDLRTGDVDDFDSPPLSGVFIAELRILAASQGLLSTLVDESPPEAI